MAKTTMQHFMDQLAEIYEYRDSDPRRARYLRDRLYKSVLEKIATTSTATPRDDMVKYAQTALQAEEIEIAPFPRQARR